MNKDICTIKLMEILYILKNIIYLIIHNLCNIILYILLTLLICVESNMRKMYSESTVILKVLSLSLSLTPGPPGPPGGLVVKNVNETSLELRWSRGYDNHSPIGKYLIMGRSEHSSDWKRMRTGKTKHM